MKRALLLLLASCAAAEKPVEIKSAPPVTSAIPSATVADPPSKPKHPKGLAFESINDKGRVDFGGHVVILDFWATWCQPCKKAFPKLQAIYDAHEGEGLIVMGLAMDEEKDAPLDFVRSMRTTFPIGIDEGQATYTGHHLTAMPTTLVLDRNGKVRYRHDGWKSGEEADLEHEVTELLKEESAEGATDSRGRGGP